MKALIRLELRKQRKTFLSFLFVVIMCLTVVAANVSIFAKVSFPEIFDAFTATLQLFGLPLFGLLFGAGPGAALRRSERKAEEDIPVPASKRVFAAYITSLIYLIVLSSILFAPSILSSIFHIRELPPHILFISILPIHTASFVFSYLFSQALIGGIAAMTATGTFTFVIYLNHGLFLPAFESPVEILISFLAISLVPLLLISDFDVSLFL
ncbi:MAG TPA: hypothetical protein VH815_05755, partial [Acidobacteriota bacterium]